MYKVLVVDDEPEIVGLLKLYLEMYGYQVLTAYDVETAWECWQQNSVDIVLTDIMMPNADGYSLVEKIRGVSNVPIMFLSAKTDITDKVKGFYTGADDYIVKPFDPTEVVTRVNANLRRCYGYGRMEKDNELICSDLKLDMDKCCLRKNGQIIELTALEYKMIQYFMENQGRVLTKNQIYENCWEENRFPDDNSIMVAVSKLRSKIQDEKHRYIHTIRGLGYRMEAGDEK